MYTSLTFFLKSRYGLFKAIRSLLAIGGYFKSKTSVDLEESWKNRIKTVLLSPDNNRIHRVSDAGKIKGDVQIMHNGIKIHVGSYYGDGNTVLLHKNRGVHEPAEEMVFEQIVRLLPSNSTMLELGSFWAFYSMTFQRHIKNANNYLIEPDRHAFLSGKNNFRLNKLKGHFYNLMVSDHCEKGSVGSITVDQFLKDNNIDRLQILHSDIQGFEYKMLVGATQNLQGGKIEYIFISTHSNELHYDCIAYLKKYNYIILCEANLDEAYSWDGLVVAKHKDVPVPEQILISKK